MKDSIQNFVVCSTKNYGLFKILNSNRSIKKRNVEKLMKSFKITKGMMISKPIIVDKELNVIDGQHRLAACKELGIPVHYVITNDSIENIPLYNTYQEKWGMEDYVNYYATKNNENYIRLLKVK